MDEGPGSDLTFDDDGKFQETRGADQAPVRVMNDLGEVIGLGFTEENSGKC